MIELLIDWLDQQIAAKERIILNGAFNDLLIYRVAQSEYKTLLAIRDKAQQLAAGGEPDDEE